MKQIFAILFAVSSLLVPHRASAVTCGAPLPAKYSAAKTNAKVRCLENAVTALQGAAVATPTVQQTNFITATVTAAGILYQNSSDSAYLSMTVKLKNKTSGSLRIQTLDYATLTDNMNGICNQFYSNGITHTSNVNNTNQSDYTLVRSGAAVTVSFSCSTSHGGVISPKATKVSLSQNFLIFDPVNGNHVEAIAFTDISPQK